MPQPGGSVKDRATLGMVLDAERRGFLKPRSVIIEPAAGNTGIGLAHIGRQRGDRVILVVPANFSREKLTLTRALGGEVILTPEDSGMRGVIDRAYEVAAAIRRASTARKGSAAVTGPGRPAARSSTRSSPSATTTRCGRRRGSARPWRGVGRLGRRGRPCRDDPPARHGRTGRVVTIVPDGMERYLSNGIVDEGPGDVLA